MHPVPVVHNVVATIQIKCNPIDIDRLANLLPYSSYDKTKFAAITIRLFNPTCTCLLFVSGKLVVTGASNWDEALLTAFCIRDILREHHYGEEFNIVDYQVQNVVAHVELDMEPGQTLDLAGIYQDHCNISTYQPNMFPGLIFRPKPSPVVLLCFKSGKFVITGGKSIQDIHKGWEELWPLMQRYVV